MPIFQLTLPLGGEVRGLSMYRARANSVTEIRATALIAEFGAVKCQMFSDMTCLTESFSDI